MNFTCFHQIEVKGINGVLIFYNINLMVGGINYVNFSNIIINNEFVILDNLVLNYSFIFY
ncbi:hypothetical protein A4A28_04080 [Staphylococcus hominis]|nr:hypothetical protein A4A31_02330 [Staphylococcus hominis]OIS48406.1 hypothetical protein A4A25_02865 [Staphylococcus hominis]OIS51011.1 hypothetical protein A4A27_06125 [Staphylococcus hominis]OIS51960.1 hypothetical protein A4A28_04080 [Staphylococcus hominis]